jgi:SAM-dependent methyltransferase
MKNIFPLFCDHLELARHWWQQLVRHGDTVLDATCGQGYDTLALARLALASDKGTVFAVDIQPQAIAATEKRLADALSPEILERVVLLKHDHATVPVGLLAMPLTLAVYNLGYLPGSDKQLITTATGTLCSLQAVLPQIKAGGAISIMCYLGHPGGIAEYDAIIAWASLLPRTWSVCSHRWINATNTPGCILLQRAH